MTVELRCVHYTQSLSLSVYVLRQHLAASWASMELPKVIPYPFVAEWMFGLEPISIREHLQRPPEKTKPAHSINHAGDYTRTV